MKKKFSSKSVEAMKKYLEKRRESAIYPFDLTYQYWELILKAITELEEKLAKIYKPIPSTTLANLKRMAKDRDSQDLCIR